MFHCDELAPLRDNNESTETPVQVEDEAVTNQLYLHRHRRGHARVASVERPCHSRHVLVHAQDEEEEGRISHEEHEERPKIRGSLSLHHCRARRGAWRKAKAERRPWESAGRGNRVNEPTAKRPRGPTGWSLGNSAECNG